MTAILSLTVTEEGLRLPRQLFPQLGEVEVIELSDYILIRPKTGSTQSVKESRPAVIALYEAGFILLLPWENKPSTPPTNLERAELGRKLGRAQPLSEIIIADRADRI
jgi:hypothetical protein